MVSCSAKASSSPPSSAPSTRPTPPITRAVKPWIASGTPIRKCAEILGDTSSPASPATALPPANESAVTRDRLMPISAAARRSIATASKHLPQMVRSKKSHAEANAASVTAMMK